MYFVFDHPASINVFSFLRLPMRIPLNWLFVRNGSTADSCYPVCRILEDTGQVVNRSLI